MFGRHSNSSLYVILHPSVLRTKDIFMLDSDKVVWEFHNWNNTKLRERKVKNIPEIRSIFCGPQSAFFVTTDSKVWCSGANGFGNLGLGDFNEREFPQLLEFPKPVDKIACGDSHTIILCEDSSIWVSGRNNQGQLGIIVQGGTVTKQHFTPIFIQAVPRSKIISVSCGSGHSIFLREDGVVLGCGSNSRRQLVCSDGTKRFPTIVEIPLKESVEFIFANNKRSFYIDTEGKLFYCGNNHQTICRITFPSGEPEPYFAAVTQGKDDSYIVARDLDGTLWSIRSPLHRSRLPISLNYSVPIRLPEELSSICGFRRSPKKSARK